MELHGQAMLDYLMGEEDAYCILRRDDGIAYPPIYARQFFYPDGLPELDRIADRVEVVEGFTILFTACENSSSATSTGFGSPSRNSNRPRRSARRGLCATARAT